MKKTIFFMLCMAAMATFFTSCDKDDKDDNNNEQTELSGNAKMLVGRWNIKSIVINDATTVEPEGMYVTMNQDGTGVFEDNGVTENNDFTWSLSGDKLTVTLRHGQQEFTVEKLTSTDCTMSGNTYPGSDQNLGDVEINLKKV